MSNNNGSSFSTVRSLVILPSASSQHQSNRANSECLIMEQCQPHYGTRRMLLVMLHAPSAVYVCYKNPSSSSAQSHNHDGLHVDFVSLLFDQENQEILVNGDDVETRIAISGYVYRFTRTQELSLQELQEVQQKVQRVAQQTGITTTRSSSVVVQQQQLTHTPSEVSRSILTSFNATNDAVQRFAFTPVKWDNMTTSTTYVAIARQPLTLSQKATVRCLANGHAQVVAAASKTSNPNNTLANALASQGNQLSAVFKINGKIVDAVGRMGNEEVIHGPGAHGDASFVAGMGYLSGTFTSSWVPMQVLAQCVLPAGQHILELCIRSGNWGQPVTLSGVGVNVEVNPLQ